MANCAKLLAAACCVGEALAAKNFKLGVTCAGIAAAEVSILNLKKRFGRTDINTGLSLPGLHPRAQELHADEWRLR
jgi:hypothetical protein